MATTDFPSASSTRTPRVHQVSRSWELVALLETHAKAPTPLVIQTTTSAVSLKEISAVFADWAGCASDACGAALVVPASEVSAVRGVAWDLADLGAVVGVFSERELTFAAQHALAQLDLSTKQKAFSAASDVQFQAFLSSVIASSGRPS